MTLNYEELIIEKLNDIKEDQKNLRDDFKELKHDLNHRIDKLEDDLNNFKENHLTHPHEDVNKINNNYNEINTKMKTNFRWIHGILIAILGVSGSLLASIFIRVWFP